VPPVDGYPCGFPGNWNGWYRNGRYWNLGTKMEGTKLVGAKTERPTDTVTSHRYASTSNRALRSHIGVSRDTEMMDTYRTEATKTEGNKLKGTRNGELKLVGTWIRELMQRELP